MAKTRGNRIEKKERWALTFLLAGIMAATSILFLLILYCILQGIFKINLLDVYSRTNLHAKTLVPLTILIILFLSYLLSFGVSKLLTIPIERILYCMKQLGMGNYKVRLEHKGPLKNVSTIENFTNSFNKMASELEHTDTLNNDFINNFSHEFKTPIVSIAGFAKLLKKGNLPQEQQTEYLTIIEEESVRLSNLAVGVMNMMKIENLEILNNLCRFNISEQIRNCILLLETKWSRKNLNIEPDFDEYYIWASEELLKHVWINLLDNAIKFSPKEESIIINIGQNEKNLIVTITNTGIEIPKEVQPHIFNKFYQSDESHSQEGYGIGLAIVKKVTELHHGKVSVVSDNNKTSFTITLPI